MKKKYIVILLIIMFGLGIGVDKLLLSNKDIEDGFNDLSQVKHEHMLSMMLEQNAGSGDYSLETRCSWPTQEEGYVFNSTLSKCEKGSKLRWDDENNAVVMVGTTSDKCYVYFDIYNAIKINSSSATVSGNSIIISIDATAGDGAISKYYYSKDNGQSYVDSTSNTYTFTGLTTGDYTIKYYVEDTNGKPSEVITKQLSVTSVTLAAWAKSQYTPQGANNLYYHDSSLANGAGDNSYRYAGSSDTTNNFVCFGSDAATCPDDNLYRIIGVFGDKVKLIKYDYATTSLIGTGYSTVLGAGNKTSIYKGSNSTSSIGVYHWNSTGVNTWSTSTLNTTNLNTNFINNIGTERSNKISTTTWIVGGNTAANIYNTTAANAYKNEYTNPAESTTVNAKIGLMYTSDYGFAASPSAWTTNLGSYDSSSITVVNWMYMGLGEFTITRRSGTTVNAMSVSNSGAVGYCSVSADFDVWAVRPVFYLESSVNYVSGTGTKEDSIRIN